MLNRCICTSSLRLFPLKYQTKMSHNVESTKYFQSKSILSNNSNNKSFKFLSSFESASFKFLVVCKETRRIAQCT